MKDHVKNIAVRDELLLQGLSTDEVKESNTIANIEITDENFKMYEKYIDWLLRRVLKLFGISFVEFNKDCYDVVDEMKQEAVRGLLEASQRFDASKNTLFSTYAFYYMYNGLRSVLFQYVNTSHVSLGSIYDMHLGDSLGEEASLDDMMCMPSYMEDFLATYSYELNVDEYMYKIVLKEPWLRLNDLDRYLLVRHYVAESSQPEIAEDIGYSVSSVSRRIHAAQKSLRESLEQLYGITSFYDIV